jgi:hypothetical protein
MLITWNDIAFVLAGAIVIIWGLWRRPRPPDPLPAPGVTSGELMLTLLAAVPAAVGPNILVVALTPGMPSMPVLVRWALFPSIALLVVVWVLARRAGYTRLVNRIETGVWVGLVATAAGPSALSDLVGSLYHIWVSACFGLAYALLVGRTRWWGGLVWGLIIEVGMMTTPPMVVAMGTGYFGLAAGKGILNGVFLGSLVPHITYGIALGLLLERYLTHRGTLLHLLRAAPHPPSHPG